VCADARTTQESSVGDPDPHVLGLRLNIMCLRAIYKKKI
jgi:hypothetical protein